MTELHKGIFWLIDGGLFVIKARTNSQGEILEGVELSAKSKTNFNHRAEWERLPKKITQGKPFDYYPRGRVEFAFRKNLTVKVYLNPTLCTEEIKQEIITEFGLTKENGVDEITFIADGSAHYQAKI